MLYSFKFGVSGRIKGSDMTSGQNAFSIHVLLFSGFLAELYIMRCIFGGRKKKKNSVMWDQVYETGVESGEESK